MPTPPSPPPLPSLPSSAAVRALLDPYDVPVDRHDGGVAFTRVDATLLARREWRYDAFVGVASHRAEGGEVSAAWLELPHRTVTCAPIVASTIVRRATTPDDTARIPRGVFPVSALSALEYTGTRTLALGPLDPAFLPLGDGPLPGRR